MRGRKESLESFEIPNPRRDDDTQWLLRFGLTSVRNRVLTAQPRLTVATTYRVRAAIPRTLRTFDEPAALRVPLECTCPKQQPVHVQYYSTE